MISETPRPLTDEQRAQLNGYSERFQVVTLRAWRARGFDVSEYEGTLLATKVGKQKRPRPTGLRKACQCAASDVGTLLKKSLAWTGIPPCQRCSALADELNTLTPDEVLQQVDQYAARLLENMKALSRGEAEGLTWWQTKSAKVKAKVALAVVGEESALAYARAYIVKACESATCAGGECGVLVPEGLVSGGDHVVEGASGVLVADGGGVEGVVGRTEPLSEQNGSDADAEPHSSGEKPVNERVNESHGFGPSDGSGPIHNAGLSLSDHGNFANPKEKLMSPAPPETVTPAGLLPPPVSPGASDSEVTE